MPYHRPSLAVVRPRRERSERPRRWPTGCPKAMGYAHAHNAKPGPQHHGTESNDGDIGGMCLKPVQAKALWVFAVWRDWV